MYLPPGKDLGIIDNPLQDDSLRYLLSFAGLIEIKTYDGEGFILSEKGKLLAACFQKSGDIFRGKEALARMKNWQAGNQFGTPVFTLREYTLSELKEAKDLCSSHNLSLENHKDEKRLRIENFLDERKLKNLMRPPGVIAVSAFFEGFAVQSFGEADFEEIAAMAEDFLRAGMKIARELTMGPLDQILLETGENKCLIAPYGDLYLCLLTTSDANLGLIRLALKNIREEAE
jgi:predicted regulator of Ras-like GTPase activity (Roadblock/LC7/MglB family)